MLPTYTASSIPIPVYHVEARQKGEKSEARDVKLNTVLIKCSRFIKPLESWSYLQDHGYRSPKSIKLDKNQNGCSHASANLDFKLCNIFPFFCQSFLLLSQLLVSRTWYPPTDMIKEAGTIYIIPVRTGQILYLPTQNPPSPAPPSGWLAVFESHVLLQPLWPSKAIKIFFSSLSQTVFKLYFGSEAQRSVFNSSGTREKHQYLELPFPHFLPGPAHISRFRSEITFLRNPFSLRNLLAVPSARSNNIP